MTGSGKGGTDPLDMTGQWNGTFAYPAGLGPATPFLATIADAGGGISGTVTEPEIVLRTGRTMEAVLAGHRSGRALDFTKQYRGQAFGYDNPVDYVGQLADDGLSATGVWSLLDMNGTWEMHRDALAESVKQRETEVKLPEPVTYVT